MDRRNWIRACLGLIGGVLGCGGGHPLPQPTPVRVAPKCTKCVMLELKRERVFNSDMSVATVTSLKMQLDGDATHNPKECIAQYIPAIEPGSKRIFQSIAMDITGTTMCCLWIDNQRS